MKTPRPVLSITAFGLLAFLLLLGCPLLAQNKPAAQAPESSLLAHELIGTWVLVSQIGRTGDTPWARGRLKFLTGQHWTTTQADPDTGLTIYHHGGTYTLDGDQYAETLEYANESTPEYLKETFHFTVKVEGDTLTQTGVDNPWSQVWRRASPNLLVPGRAAEPFRPGIKQEPVIKQTLANDFRLQGPAGREVILHTNGGWEFAEPLQAFKVSAGERTVQVLDVRATSARRLSLPVVNPEGKSEGKLPTALQVQFHVESSRTPTEYDLPESLLRVEALDPASGEILATNVGTHFGSGAAGFVWRKLPPGAYSDVDTVEFERPQGWPQQVGLRFVYKKSYTPPPNETTFEFKEVPVFQ